MTDGNQCITVESLSNQHLACLGEVINDDTDRHLHRRMMVTINSGRHFFFFLYTLLLTTLLLKSATITTYKLYLPQSYNAMKIKKAMSPAQNADC